jgi:hypothetical protein
LDEILRLRSCIACESRYADRGLRAKTELRSRRIGSPIRGRGEAEAEPRPRRRDDMRSSKWCACALALLATAAGQTLAQDKTDPDASRRPARARTARRPKAPRDTRTRRSRYAYPWRYELDRIAKELALSEDQKKLVTDAIEVQQEKLKEQEEANAAKLKELYEQSRKVREQMMALSKARYRRRDAYKAKIAEVLTDDQKVKWVQMRLKESILRSYYGLKFTDEQSKKIDALLAESAKKIAPLAVEKQDEAIAKAAAELKKAVDALLPADQRKLARANWLAEQTLRMFRRVELSEEQTAKVKALAVESLDEADRANARIEALTKELHGLRTKTRPTNYIELTRKVRESVLTDEQRAKLSPRGIWKGRKEPPKRAKPRD